jgi:uncharacterized protein involved in oxidation of intracellular sulfur
VARASSLSIIVSELLAGDGVEPRVFLMGDAVTCAIAGQKTPDGYYALDRMLRSFARHGGGVACCGTCLDARGLAKEHLIAEAPRSSMAELADRTLEADQVLTF